MTERGTAGAARCRGTRRTTTLVVTGLAALGLLGACDATGQDPAPTPVTASPTTSARSTPTPTQASGPTATATPPSSAGGTLFVDTDTQAHAAWEQASGVDRDLLAQVALTPQARWIGDWYDAASVTGVVADYTGRAAAAGAVAMLVVYAIPGRDCGLYSAGGVETSEYAAWVDAVAAGITGEPLVVLEPDALASLGDCDGQGDRAGYLAYGAQALTAAGAHVYVDIGHSGWLPVAAAVERLQQVGVTRLAGFALNTSNYQATADERAYGEQIAAALGGDVGFVVDTSRNGNGSNGEWCNPRGRAIGEAPRLVDDGTHLDALLWVKAPGESDGTCNGGPAAGQWWQEIALELVRDAA